MLVCVLYFTVYVYVCVQTNVCVPLYNAKGIDDVALITNKIDWLIDKKRRCQKVLQAWINAFQHWQSEPRVAI